MSLLVPDEGEEELLNYMLGKKDASPGYVLHLYTSPTITPVEDWTLMSMTEVSLPSYAPITLSPSNWTISTDAYGITTASYEVMSGGVTFSMGAMSTTTDVYGYYATDISSTKMLFVERFGGAPFTIPVTGGTITVWPKLELD